MTIKLKTNRNGFIKWLIPWFIIGSTIYVFLMLDIYYNKNSEVSSKGISIALAIFLGILLFSMLICRFAKRKSHIFSENTIKVYDRNKLLYDIKVDDIVSIAYTRSTIEYVYKWFTGDVSRGGPVCMMCISMKQKNIITLGCFTTMQAKKIKNLYGDLVTII